MATTKARISDPPAPRRAWHRALGDAQHLALRRLRWHHILIGAAILAYLGIWTWTGSFTINNTDFDVFFLPSARVAISGHPLLIYQVRYEVKYPNANGPLSLVPLTLIAWVEQHLGWLDAHELRRALAMGLFAVFPLLLAREALLALDRLLGAPLTGPWRVVTYAVFAFSPELWHSVLLYGHIEQPIMIWLTLWSVRALVERRIVTSGVLIGLALLTRSTAVLYLLPLLLVLAFRGRWQQALRFGITAAITVLAGVAPFLLADSKDVVYSLVTFRSTLIVGGGSIWGAIQNNPGVALFAQQHDSIVILGAALLLTALTLWLRRDLDVGSADLYLLLAVSGLCFPLFIKTLWPYYFLDMYMLIALWWLAQLRFVTNTSRIVRWAVAFLLPAATVGLAQLAESVLSADNYQGWTQSESLMVFTCNAVFTLVLLALLWLGPHLRAQSSAARLALNHVATTSRRYT